jgi:hypothetical protein
MLGWLELTRDGSWYKGRWGWDGNGNEGMPLSVNIDGENVKSWPFRLWTALLCSPLMSFFFFPCGVVTMM